MTPDPYTDWLETRRHTHVPQNFCNQVMGAIHDQQHVDKRFRIFQRNIGRQWAAAGGLLIAGLFRLAYIAWHLIWPGWVAP